MLFLAVFAGLLPVYAQRAPIDVNLIIDGSASLSPVKNEISTWIDGRFNQILIDGDRVTVWNAGNSAIVVFTGRIEGNAREAVKKSIQDISPSGSVPDFSSALREAQSRQSSPFSYTLLICASPSALSSTINSTQGNLLRFSRIEEFSNWRALVVGLNLDTRVRRAASAFINN